MEILNWHAVQNKLCIWVCVRHRRDVACDDHVLGEDEERGIVDGGWLMGNGVWKKKEPSGSFL